MGKTSFALNIATRVAMQQKVPVAIFSLEMTKEQLTNRILSAEAGIDSQAFRTGALRAEDWEYLALATEKLHDAPIYMDDTSGITITEMKAKIRRVNQDPARPNVGLIVIDYLQLMTSGQRSENRVQEISSITRNLKIMAKEMNVPIIALEPAVPCGGKAGQQLQPPPPAVRPARLRLHRAGRRLRPLPVPRLLLRQPNPRRRGGGRRHRRVHRGKEPSRRDQHGAVGLGRRPHPLYGCGLQTLMNYEEILQTVRGFCAREKLLDGKSISRWLFRAGPTAWPCSALIRPLAGERGIALTVCHVNHGLRGDGGPGRSLRPGGLRPAGPAAAGVPCR